MVCIIVFQSRTMSALPNAGSSSSATALQQVFQDCFVFTFLTFAFLLVFNEAMAAGVVRETIQLGRIPRSIGSGGNTPAKLQRHYKNSLVVAWYALF
jgi:hypothetical protein